MGCSSPGIGSDLGKNGKFAMGLGGWEVILPVALRRFSLGRKASKVLSLWVPTGSAPVPGLTVSATELRSHQRPCGGAGQGVRPCPTAAECRARRVPARAAGRGTLQSRSSRGPVTKLEVSALSHGSTLTLRWREMDSNHRFLSQEKAGLFCGRRIAWGSDGAPKKFAGYRWFEIHLPPAVSQVRTAIARRNLIASGRFSSRTLPRRRTGSRQMLEVACPTGQPCHADVSLEIANLEGKP